MKPEIKKLLKIKIKAVRKSKIKLFIGIILLLLIIILVSISYISIYSLFSLPILLYALKGVIMEYNMNRAILMLARYLLDDDYSKEFDKKNNIKN